MPSLPSLLLGPGCFKILYFLKLPSQYICGNWSSHSTCVFETSRKRLNPSRRMLLRPSKGRIRHDAYKHLQSNRQQSFTTYLDAFRLPWLCPTLCRESYYLPKPSTIVQRPENYIKPSSTLPRYTARLGQQQRRYASAAPEPLLSSDEYIPFESPSGIHTAPAFSNHPLPETNSLTDLQPFDPGSPLIVDNSLITVAPRFKHFNNIGGEIEEITQTLYACLQLGRFERAANLMRRLQTIYKPDAAGLLHAHNEYIRELTWKIIFTRDLRLLKSLQKWFEVELRSRGAIPNATTFGLMIQASLQEADARKADRAIRRYIHLAEAGGLRDQTMNELLAILNHQELGRVTRVRVRRRKSHVYMLSIRRSFQQPSKISMSQLQNL